MSASQARKKILLLFAHPSQQRSEVNLPMFELAKSLDFVTYVDLYREYPRHHININREQQRLVEHDIVIFQFPFYWYSTPSLLKEWQDLVLEYNFAYGPDGTALHGKTFICALSAGGAEQAYRADGYNHFTVRELLQPLEQTARLTGMRYLPPFAIFSSRSTQCQRQQHLAHWRKLLEALSFELINHDKVAELTTINDALPALPNLASMAV
ncbi:flavodoxin family protein [Thalassotalea euphylliae]|uniref:Flavodoxin family protein n=1 Tax=Thalassotalea euphylliae TaxID=1655234 RepID=A0A3E0TST0_9GAMM|nr:NAD(P)H-dependent oxidoreductase [Thalassotalea euphylliae]REL27711.1 flavodoxin family protein [Thalassotalea euphylliae]